MTAEAIRYPIAGTQQHPQRAVAGEKEMCPQVLPYIFSAADIVASLQHRVDAPGATPATARQARHALTAYLAYIADRMLADHADMRSRDHYLGTHQADSDHLRRFAQWMTDDRYATATATHYLRAIRAAMRHAGHHIDIADALSLIAQQQASSAASEDTVSPPALNEQALTAPAVTATDAPRWYALRNHTDLTDANLTTLLADKLGDTDAAYNPELTVKRRDRQGRLVTAPSPLLRRLILVKCTRADLRDILTDSRFAGHLQPYTDADRTPQAIPDAQIDMFALLLRLSSDADAQLDLIDTDRHARALAAGTPVQVTGGAFAGLRGTVARIRRDRRVVVHIPGLCALATPHIPPQLLQQL